MIEKLKNESSYNDYLEKKEMVSSFGFYQEDTFRRILEKVNELVDAINRLECKAIKKSDLDNL